MCLRWGGSALILWYIRLHLDCNLKRNTSSYMCAPGLIDCCQTRRWMEFCNKVSSCCRLAHCDTSIIHDRHLNPYCCRIRSPRTHTRASQTHHGVGHRLKVKWWSLRRGRKPAPLRRQHSEWDGESKSEQCVRFYLADIGTGRELIWPRDTANYADTSCRISLRRTAVSRGRHTAPWNHERERNGWINGGRSIF